MNSLFLSHTRFFCFLLNKMAKMVDADSWSSYAENFQADDRRLFKDMTITKQFYDGFEKYQVKLITEDGETRKFLVEKEDGTFQKKFSNPIALVSMMIYNSLLSEAKRMHPKTLRLVVASGVYPLHRTMEILKDNVKVLGEENGDEFEGFTLAIYKNGACLNFYKYDEIDPYWFERKAVIFIEANETKEDY